MKIVDQIRGYVETGLNDGSLKPGSRLPSNHELARIFSITYNTARLSLQKLAREGLVEVKNGSGSYIAGASELKVLINLHPTSISFKEMHRLLKKHTANADLHLDFEFQAVEKLAEPNRIRDISQNYKAALSLHSDVVNEQELPATLLSQFEDYHRVAGQLNDFSGSGRETALPFSCISYQMGVNRKLLAEAGYELTDLTLDFAWWDDFVAGCRQRGLIPASIDYVEMAARVFYNFIPLMLALMPYDERRYHGDGKLWNSPEGRCILQVAKDSEWISNILWDKRSFYQNGAVLNPFVGSWILVQNGVAERPDKRVDELAIVPYRNSGGRTPFLIHTEYLKAFMRPDMSIGEKKRVWELMKIMVSREFQLDYCGAAGLISARKGIYPGEYFWNRSGQGEAFFPKAGDPVFSINELFTLTQRTAFSVLLENWKFFGSSAKETLLRLDDKKKFHRIDVIGDH